MTFEFPLRPRTPNPAKILKKAPQGPVIDVLHNDDLNPLSTPIVAIRDQQPAGADLCGHIFGAHGHDVHLGLMKIADTEGIQTSAETGGSIDEFAAEGGSALGAVALEDHPHGDRIAA